MFYPQSNFSSQGSVGYPQASNGIPFANSLYGYPQSTPSLVQGLPQFPNWQHAALQQAQQQAALQQQAMLHQLATQLAQPFTQQPFTQPQLLQGTSAFAGSANGAIPATAAWQQPQANPEQINAALLLQSQQQLLQRLAQYHHLVAQQLAQLAQQVAQQATQSPVTPFTGQFMPGQFAPSGGQFIGGQLGTNFVPGITMH